MVKTNLIFEICNVNFWCIGEKIKWDWYHYLTYRRLRPIMRLTDMGVGSGRQGEPCPPGFSNMVQI